MDVCLPSRNTRADPSKADWKYTRIYNPQRRLRVLVERCRKDSSQVEIVKTGFSARHVFGLILIDFQSRPERGGTLGLYTQVADTLGSVLTRALLPYQRNMPHTMILPLPSDPCAVRVRQDAFMTLWGFRTFDAFHLRKIRCSMIHPSMLSVSNPQMSSFFFHGITANEFLLLGQK
ncbi:hypothetical protein TNCV_3466741 [Trichonephila clavipes]|nr:hypothetical protein TNCV_3466741 [Trichonephila clavipes]